MFVASHHASEREAAAAELPRVIGHIDTAAGLCTVCHEGITTQAEAGGPVCEGDLIETGPDGLIAVSLFDGTRFVLSKGTRVILNGSVFDGDAGPEPGLRTIKKGSIPRLAGRREEKASVDKGTPPGGPTGRGATGGFGLLSLTALSFATMSDVRAADPDATYLDDDTIAYKDFEHGAFELWTKEATPRHILVEDPGETIVLTQKGSSVSVSQIANSPARMEELQAEQQAVLSNYARGYGPNGSSTPYFLETAKPQPINFIAPAGNTLPGVLPPLPDAPPLPIIEPFDPPPKPPILDTGTGPTLIDTSTLDHFAASGGRFVASSSQGAALTFGIEGGVASNTVIENITYDLSKTGLYGTLFLSSTTGSFIYVPDDAAINALAAPTSESFAITVSDGTRSVSQVYTVILDGVNDAAIITGTSGGAVVEDGGIANASSGAPTASGTLFDTDVDNPANTFRAINAPTPSEKGYGTFTMTPAGLWTYTLDNTDPAVQALNVGGTLIDQFTVASEDGTTQVVSVTIAGRNDAAVISGRVAGSVIEAGTSAPGTPIASGTLTDADVDNAPNMFEAIGSSATSKGYGTFTITTAGVWTYMLDNAHAAVQALNAGETLTDTFTVKTVDGTAQVVTITIVGTNDAAIISGTITGTVVEATTSDAGSPTATGVLSAFDADNSINTFTAVQSPSPSSQGYGNFTLTSDGLWTYTLNNNNAAVQALNVGDPLTDSFTIATVDGTTQVVTIKIIGSNDAAIISGTITSSVTEAGTSAPGVSVATGTLFDTDVDNLANRFEPVRSPTFSSNGYGTFVITEAGTWTYALDNSNSSVQALNVGQTLTDTFTVTTVDGTAQTVTITILGANDAAVLAGTTTGAVIEASGTTAGTPVASGTLTDIDVDNINNSFVEVASPTRTANGYGFFTITAAGGWTYRVDNTNTSVQALNVGHTLTDSFTVATVDGTTQLVTITISGTNDAAVISGTTTGQVTEAGTGDPGMPVASGTLSDTDVDNPDNSFIAVTSPTASNKGYGTFVMTAAGLWTYTLDNTNSAVQNLDLGQTLTDTFAVTTLDGSVQTVTIVIHGSSDADPNDFDNLALGNHVVTDAPFVYGTPGGDSIAGGGDQFQIVYAGAGNDTVNGTGKDDVLYGGSGDDTIKGNDGSDTIYGGSGNDTINANNGDDTITGGFGADKLTGSNGDDVFVYLSVADSNSGQFDTITDFSTGSDKINLAALGGLGFVHLSSTNSPVPPHTIAWIYNSASNETIVYINPTDVARSVGDSALLEIHLQGVVSVQDSDFVYQVAANASAVTIEATGAALQSIASDNLILSAASTEFSSETSATTTEAARDTTFSWGLQAAAETFTFQFDRYLGSAAPAKMARFEQPSTYQALDTDDQAAIAPATLTPIDLWHQATASQAENQFVFHQEPIHLGAGETGSPVIPFAATGASAHESALLISSNNESSPHPPAHASHKPEETGGSNNPHTSANLVAIAELGEPEATTGGGASHGASAHEPHPTSHDGGSRNLDIMANIPLAPELSEREVSPGSREHLQPKHEPQTTSHPVAANNPHSGANSVDVQLVKLQVASEDHSNSHQPSPASEKHPPTSNASNHSSSFHFNDAIAPSLQTDFFTLEFTDVSNAHGNGKGHEELATILEILTPLAPSEEQASHVPLHASGHGTHELLL
jgi:VCBS repeat-containing protein